MILENIEYDYLKQRAGFYQDELDEIVEPMVEIICAKRKTTRIAGAALKLYELHKLSDLSALSLSHLRYFAASLIADKLSAQALADAVMAIPNLEAAALQLADRSERRYGGVQKAFAAAGKSALLREEISALSTWLLL